MAKEWVYNKKTGKWEKGSTNSSEKVNSSTSSKTKTPKSAKESAPSIVDSNLISEESKGRAGAYDIPTSSKQLSRYTQDVRDNIYKVGGSSQLGESKYNLGRIAKESGVYRSNLESGKQYSGLSDDEVKKYLELSLTDQKEAEKYWNQARARTGDKTVLNGMPMSKEAKEYERLLNLHARDMVDESLNKKTSQPSKASVANLFDSPDAMTKWLEGQYASGDEAYAKQMKSLLSEKDTIGSRAEMYSNYTRDDYRNDLNVIYSYNNPAKRGEITDDDYTRAMVRAQAATGIDFKDAVSKGLDVNWFKGSLDAYDAGQNSMYEELKASGALDQDMSYEDYLDNMDAVHAQAAAQEKQQQRMDDWQAQTSAKSAQIQGSEGYSTASAYRQDNSIGQLSPNADYLNGQKIYYDANGNAMRPEEYRQAVIDSILNEYVAAGNDPDARAALEGYSGLIPELQNYNLEAILYMSDEQKRNFFYLYNSGDKNSARAYLESLDYGLQAQRYQDMVSEYTADMQENAINKVLGSAGSVPRNLMNNIAGSGVWLANTLGLDTYADMHEFNPLFDYTAKAQIARGETGKAIADATKGLEILGTNIPQAIYNAGMSAADSAANAYLFGRVGSAMMGSGAYMSGLQQNLMAGDDIDKADQDASAQGLVEMGTEFFSIDKLLSDVSNPVKYFIQNALVEGSEEGASTILNTIYDNLANGGESEVNQRINELMTQGYTREDAKKAAWIEWGKGLFGDVFTGVLSGGMSSGPRAAAIYASDAGQGRTIAANETQQPILDIAASLELDPDTMKLVQEQQAALNALKESEQQTEVLPEREEFEFDGTESSITPVKPEQQIEKLPNREAEAPDGKLSSITPVDKKAKKEKKAKVPKVSNAKMGRIVREAMRKLDAQAQRILSDSFKTEVTQELQGRGYKGNLQAAADAIVKMATGMTNQITPEVMQAAISEKAVLDLVNEYTAPIRQRNELIALGAKGYQNPAKATTDVPDEVEETPAESTIDGKTVKVTGLKSVGDDGTAMVEIVDADGNVQEVDMEEVAFGAVDEGVAAMARMASNLGRNADTFLNNINEGQDQVEYAEAFETAMNFGRDGRNLDKTKSSEILTSVLTPEQIDIAYNLGRNTRQQNARMVRKNASGISVGNVDTSGINMSTLSRSQRASVNAVGRLAKAIGFNVRFVESKANALGKYTTENGSWDARTMTMTLDVHAGSNYASDTNYAMMHTAGHELTHYIKDFADSGLWNEYQEFVIGHLSENMDETALEAKIQQHMRANPNLNRDGAIEEIIADASGDALMNISEAEIQQIAETNPGLFNKLKAFFEKWIVNLKKYIDAAYKGTEAKTAEAKAMHDVVDQLSEKWNKLLVNAAHNQKVASEATTMTAEDGGAQALNYAHIDARTEDSVRNVDMDLFCKEVEQAQIGFAAAAEILLADVNNSTSGQKFFTGDGEVTGQKRQTSDLIARIKDETGWTWDNIRKSLQQFADMDDASKGYPMPKNTLTNRRMELYLDEMLTEGYKTLDGTNITQWGEYVEAKAGYKGSKKAGMNYRSPANAIAFEDYAFADAGDMKYHARLGYTEDGTPVYTSDFPTGTTRAARQNKILELVQTVWAKKPIVLEIDEAGRKKRITAKFDPTVDNTGAVYSDATKLAYGNRKGTMSDQKVTEKLAYDFPELIQDSKYVSSKEEIGGKNEAHDGVYVWHYFANHVGFVNEKGAYAEYNVNVDVKEKYAGHYVYSVAAEKIKGSERSKAPNLISDPKTILASGKGITPSIATSIILNEENDVKLSARDSQTESPAFQNWFKGSKIVNDDGSPKVMYHGTPYGGFTVFKDWQYFTDNKAYADVYHEPSASSIRGRYNPATNPQTYAVYLNVKKPFDTRDPKIRKIWQEEFYNQYSRTPLSEKGLPDWTDGIDLVEFIEENDYDFDAIILDEGATGGYGDDVQSRGVSVVVRSSNQVKSATDNIGTFDPANPDILYSRRNASEIDEDGEAFSRMYEEYMNAQKELREATEKYDKAASDPELMDAMMALVDFKGSRFSLEGKAEKVRLKQTVLDIQDRLELTKLREQQEKLSERVKNLKQAMDDLESKMAVKKETQAIEKSGLSEAEYFRKKAVKEFGYTPHFVDAGYMLPNGKMLNFSGEKGKHFGTRGQDHRAIGVVYERTSGHKALTRFMNDGNIRVMAESPGIDISGNAEPTAQQYANIKTFVREYADKRYFNVDISDNNGRVIGSLTYEGKLNADKVVNDIKHYFATGEFRKQSMLSEFRYQQRDLSDLSDRELLVEALQTELSPEERDHIERYSNKVEELNRKQMQLEALNEEIIRLRAKANDFVSREELRKAETNAKTLRNSIANADKALSKVESAQMIREVIKRNRAEVRRKTAAQYKESYGKEKYRARILEDAKRLYGWVVSPTNKGYVPEFLREPLAGFIESIDFTSARQLRGGDPTKNDAKFTEALEKLRRAIGEINKQQSDIEGGATSFAGYIDLPADYMQEFDELVGKIKTALDMSDNYTETPFARMKADQLHDLAKLFRILNSSISKVNRLVANGRYESAKTASNDTISDMNAMNAKVKTNKLLSSLNSMFNWKNTTPYYAFQRLGRGGKAIFEGLQDGWDKMAQNSAQLINFAEDAFTSKQAKEWSRDIKSIKLDSGDSFQITAAQAMSLYCLSKRQQAVGHLMGGGIRISDIDMGKGNTLSQVDNYVLSEADLLRIIGTLTAEQRSVADKLQNFMNTVCTDWGNEISMKRFGYKMFTEKFYFPIETDANNRSKIDDKQDGKTSLFRLLNMSAMKTLTPNANNAIIVRDIFDVFSNHASDIGKYNALALPILDFIKWYNYVEKVDVLDANGKATGKFTTKSTQKALERAYGTDAKQYVLSFIRDMNAEHDGGRNDTVLSKLMGQAKAGSVSANMRVAFLQITSLPRAAYAIDPKYLLKGMAKVKSLNPATAIKGSEAQENIGILKWKNLGFYSTDVSRNTRSMVRRDESTISKIRDLVMKPVEWGDNWTSNIIYEAVKAEMSAKHPNVKPGTKAYDAMLNKRVREIVYKTQVVDSTMTRSDFMRSKGLMTAFTAFMSEPTLTVNMLNESIQEAVMNARTGMSARDNLRSVGGKAVRAATVMAFTATASAFVEAIFDALRDDDDYEEFREKFADAFGGNVVDNVNIFAMLPFLKDAISIMQGYENSSMVTQVVSQYKDVQEAITAWQEGKRPIYSVIYNMLKVAASATGVGVQNATRDGVGLYNTFLADAFNTPKIQTYSDSKSKAAEEFYEALQAGDEEKVEWIMQRAEINGIALPDISDKIATLVKNEFVAGDITEEEATRRLIEYGGKDENEAYWKIQEWGYSGEGNFSKYTSLKDALKSGDRAAANSARDELAEHGTSEQAISEQLSEIYNNGEATSILNLQMRSDSLYTSSLKLKADGEAHPDDFDAFITAIVNGGNISGEIESLMDKGYTVKQCMSAINGAFGKSRDTYRIMEKYNSSDAGILLDRILDAYEYLGLDRAEEIAWIDANWIM